MEIWEVDDGREQVEGLDEHGRPDPAYAASLGLRPAPLNRRAGAAAMDLAGYLVLQIPYWIFTLPLLISLLLGRISWYGFTNHPRFMLAVIMAAVSGVLTLVYAIVQLVLHGRRGFTLGKLATGIRTINVKRLGKPGFWAVTFRVFLVWASGVLVIGPVLFFLSILRDPEKRGRGWHDQAGKTWLVDVREGLDPYDEKRLRIARKMLTAEPVAQHRQLPSLATSANKDEQELYRPGARVSAGVLGVARPHGAGPREVVGLTGVEDAPAGGSLSSAAPAAPPAAPAPRVTPPTSPTPPAPPAPRTPPAASEPPRVREPAPETVTAVDPTPAAVPGRTVLVLDTGERVDVDEPLVLGRNPSAPDDARPESVADHTQSVSKTHFSVRPSGLGVEVHDLHSTNGTFVVRAASGVMTEAIEPLLAMPGDTIRFGDRTAVVEPGDSSRHPSTAPAPR